MRNFMHRWQCSIYNGTLKKLYLIKYELDIHVYSLELTENFQIVVSLRK